MTQEISYRHSLCRGHLSKIVFEQGEHISKESKHISQNFNLRIRVSCARISIEILCKIGIPIMDYCVITKACTEHYRRLSSTFNKKHKFQRVNHIDGKGDMQISSLIRQLTDGPTFNVWHSNPTWYQNLKQFSLSSIY